MVSRCFLLNQICPVTSIFTVLSTISQRTVTYKPAYTHILMLRGVYVHTHIHTHLLMCHGYSPGAGLWKSIVPHPSMGGWISNYLPSMLNYFNISTTSTYPLIIIINTLFQQHKRRLYTWTAPDGQHRNQIDYILCS